LLTPSREQTAERSSISRGILFSSSPMKASSSSLGERDPSERAVNASAFFWYCR
jgi:hypothetical protein